MGKKPLVLVADDQMVNQKIYSMILEKLDAGYILVNDGQDALEAVREKDPDLVFMDIEMPKMNGLDSAKKIRELGFKKPIIAVTANQQPNELKECFDAGMNEILIKPIKSFDIERTLKKWMENPGGKLPQDGTISMEAENKNTGKKNTIFDLDDLLDTFLHNEEAVLPLLTRFIERTKTQLENIPLLGAKGDWENAHRDAHTIKGAAFTMGGAALGNAAANLETACKNADSGEVKAALPAVNDAFLKYKKAALDYIQSRNPAGAK